MSAPHDHPPAPFSPVRFWLVVGGVIVVVLGLSALLTRHFRSLQPRAELPVYREIPGDLTATERSGATVRFSDLRGKVVVAAYLYTQCPHGCAAITGQFQQLLREHGGDPRFQLLSVAIQPERDSVALLKAYAEAVGATETSPWWFVTGDRQTLWDFMTDQVGMTPAKLIPEDERITPDDQYEHDLRIALIDPRGRVRGYYSVFHPQPEIAALMCTRLREHVRQLLRETADSP